MLVVMTVLRGYISYPIKSDAVYLGMAKPAVKPFRYDRIRSTLRVDHPQQNEDAHVSLHSRRRPDAETGGFPVLRCLFGEPRLWPGLQADPRRARPHLHAMDRHR